MTKYRGADGWLHDDSVDPPQPQPPENEPDPNKEPKKRSDTAWACCALGVFAVCPLVGAGAGYTTWGFGGLLVGGGLGVAIPVGLVVAASVSLSSKRKRS